MNANENSMKTTVGHCKADDCDVYIGRDQRGGKLHHLLNTPIGERGWLGNPFVPEENASEKHYRQSDVTVVSSREESVTRFAETFDERLCNNPEFRDAVGQLEGKTLGCWCQREHEDSPACHGEVIAGFVDRVLSKRT